MSRTFLENDVMSSDDPPGLRVKIVVSIMPTEFNGIQWTPMEYIVFLWIPLDSVRFCWIPWESMGECQIVQICETADKSVNADADAVGHADTDAKGHADTYGT